MGAISKGKLRAIKKFKKGDEVVEPTGYGGMPYDELMGVYSYPSPKKKPKKRKTTSAKEPPAEWLMDLPPMPEGMARGGVAKKKPGLYANIHAKRARIAAGSGEKMRPVGVPGAPTAKAFRKSKKTAKKK